MLEYQINEYAKYRADSEGRRIESMLHLKDFVSLMIVSSVVEHGKRNIEKKRDY